MKLLFRVIAVLLVSTAASAQTLTHVRLTSGDPEALAQSFEDEGFDVVEGSVTQTSLELVVSEASMSELLARGFSPEVVAVGRPFDVIQAERAALLHPGPEGPDMPPAGYADLAGVLSEMQAAAASFPAICEYVDLTTRYSLPLTAGSRRLFAIKISDNVAIEEDEPAFLMIGAMHSREVVTPVLCLDAIERLTTGYGVDPVITGIVDDSEVWIVPVSNPDGYNFVFTTNNLWRKNRMSYPGGVGVDLNRNYRFGWSSACAGSTNAGNDTYKGPSAGSEIETQVIEALSAEQRFAKVLDFHSFGRETLWEYACLTYPLASYLQTNAAFLSTKAGYSGAERPPSANGEHYEWQLAEFAAYSFLIETATQFQPSFAAAEAEALLIWPASRVMMRLPIPVSGHVTDACTGAPIVANITYVGLPFTNGEKNQSDPTFGRYHAWIPTGAQTLVFSAAGYQTQSIALSVGEGTKLEVAMVPDVTASAVPRNGTGINANCYTTLSPPVLGGTWISQVDHSAHAGTSLTVIAVFAAASTGPIVSGGELLVDLGSPKFFQSVVASSGTEDVHTNPLPNDPCFAGFFSATQAALLGGSGYELCNAIDLVTGY